MPNRLDTLEQANIEPKSFDLTAKLDSLNKSFQTKLAPENKIYGVTEVIKDDGTIQRTSRNDQGLLFRDYIRDGHTYLRRQKELNGNWTATSFDDNGTAYLKKTTLFGEQGIKGTSSELLANTNIVKGNFTATTDMLGRPVYNKMTDILLKGVDEGRESLSGIKRDASYLANDQKGHVVPDSFGGPASLENVVPQLDTVNLSKIKQVENLARDLKTQGNSVDYEVKVNYVGESKRPSSFEPKITVNGENYEIPGELQKIYNKDMTTVEKAVTTVGEKASIPHAYGKKAGIEAAMITSAISTVDNGSKFIGGEISAEEMVVNIAKDTGTSGTVGYGAGFVSAAVAQGMQKSSHALLQSLENGCAPAAVVSFAIDASDSVVDFAKGEIDGKELAYDLGDSAASVAGSIAGAAVAGAVVGSVVPGAGTVVGAAAGIAGSMAGYVVASEVYKTAVDVGMKGAEVVGEKAKELANETVEKVQKYVPEQVDSIKTALNDFATENSLPFYV